MGVVNMVRCFEGFLLKDATALGVLQDKCELNERTNLVN